MVFGCEYTTFYPILKIIREKTEEEHDYCDEMSGKGHLDSNDITRTIPWIFYQGISLPKPNFHSLQAISRSILWEPHRRSISSLRLFIRVSIHPFRRSICSE